MASAHVQPTSSPQLDLASASLQNESRHSPTISSDIFSPETSPSRQQRLLQNRNAKFPAKKLSISGLSNKLTQLIGNNDLPDEAKSPPRNQENKLHKSRSTGTIGKKSSLRVLEGISNTARGRASRRRPEIPVYQDNPERPLLQSSPCAASSPYVEPKGEFTSPTGFEHIQDSLNNMRLREVSLNERWSPPTKSPPLKSKGRKRSVQTTFDADEYIEHIEKELQQVKDEAYSPLTRRPMKEKLRVANKENERLQKELTMLKDKFEAEVKRTVEHKTMAELELKRKVRDLEDSLEEREHAFREMQYQHEEKRLDSNIIESLKASIERLEHEKADMEEINLSMSKRNEVLTQLLAMSPTKTTNGFNLGSPVRDKRNPRPMSLILPRQPTSPNAIGMSTAGSLACSPLALNNADISPFKLGSSPKDDMEPVNEPEKTVLPPQPYGEERVHRPLQSPRLRDAVSGNRRWTMYSDISASSITASEEQKPTRRKARRFAAGSTQLKPLLLPTLTGETLSLPSSSVASSPRSWPEVESIEADLDDTILASGAHEGLQSNGAIHSNEFEAVSITPGTSGDGPLSPVGSNTEPTSGHGSILETLHPRGDVPSDVRGLGLSVARYERAYELDNEASIYDEQPRTAATTRRDNHISRNSLQTMPMPSTPDSLVALPAPLFSPMHRDTTVAALDLSSRLVSNSPSASPQDPVNPRKRRKPPVNDTYSGSPVAKVQRRQRRQSSVHGISQASGSPLLRVAADPESQDRALTHSLRRMRSSDNFVEMFRQRNLAAKPLAALTIRTVYKILATCSSAVRDFQRDPFALARRMLANAWYMNWKALGKVSWWVLGLFLQPRPTPKARAPIDWDQYDGESIASRYCGSLSDSGGQEESRMMPKFDCENPMGCHAAQNEVAETRQLEPDHDREAEKPGWSRSLFLWGKFSAAVMLAVGGAVIKGPGEMLKDVKSQEERPHTKHHGVKSCMTDVKKSHNQMKQQAGNGNMQHHTHDRSQSDFAYEHPQPTFKDNFRDQFNFRSDTQLDSSSLLDQIQQTDLDPTLRAEQPGRRRIESLFTPPAAVSEPTSPYWEHPKTPLTSISRRAYEFSRNSGASTSWQVINRHSGDPGSPLSHV